MKRDNVSSGIEKAGRVLKRGGMVWTTAYVTRHLTLRCIPIAGHFGIAYLRGRKSYWMRGIPRHVQENLQVAFGGKYEASEIERIGRQYTEFASRLQQVKVLAGLHGFADAGRWRVDGLGNLDDALAQKKGALLITAHVGYPRFIQPILRARGYDVQRVRSGRAERIEKSGALEESLASGSRLRRYMLERAHLLSEIRDPNDIVAGLDVRPIFNALSQNKPILVAGEGMRAADFTKLSLLGQPYPFPMGYMKIAMLSGAAVLPAFALDTRDRRIRVRIDPPLPVDPRASVEANVCEYVRVLNEQLWQVPHLWTRWGVRNVFGRALEWSEVDLRVRYTGHWTGP